jgi:2-C-methyl-D-erythritol 4-phosphate cytidylyltransferase
MAAVFSVVVLTAAPPGLGEDAGGAYAKIDGRESLLRAVELFLNRGNVKQVQIVFTPDMLEEGKRKFGGHLSFAGVKVASGGPRWIDQLAAGAAKIPAEATHVVVHDAARPVVPFDDIDTILHAAEKHAAVALTAAVRAPLVELDPGGGAMAYHSATGFRQLLTPQVFTKEKFSQIVQSKSEPHASELTLIPGSALNVRVSAGEANVVNALIKILPKPKAKALSPFEEAQW